MEKKWYALYVKSRTEKKVGELISERSIEAYVPIVKTMKQWSDRKKMVDQPLFNGYVFVKINPSQNEIVLGTRGVVNFVKSEGKNAVVREIEIDRLKQLIALGYQIEAGGIKHNYSAGDKVKIISGALKNIEGFVIESKSERFIEILLESIGQVIKVKLPEEIVVPI